VTRTCRQSSPPDLSSTISVAIDLKTNGFLEKIRNELAQLNKTPVPQQSAAL